MQTRIKVLAIFILAVIVGAVWWFTTSRQSGTSTSVTQSDSQSQNTNAEVPQNLSSTPPNDISDNAMQTDLSVIDKQLDALNANSENVSPVPLIGTPAENISASVSTIIRKADTEISQRLTSLNDLQTKIGFTKKIGAQDKASIQDSITREISSLEVLKTKIDSDTGSAEAKNDYQLTTTLYENYALIYSQAETALTNDQIMVIGDSMNILSAKIKTRISEITGTNATNLNLVLADSTLKLSDANSQTQASAISDLLIARKDLSSLVTSLKEISPQ